jgi:hypothetical protein
VRGAAARMRGFLLTLLAVGVEGFFMHKPAAVVSSRRSSPASQMRMRTLDEVDIASKEATAVSEFKMITENEATIRKIAGVGIGLLSVGSFIGGAHSYTSLSGGLFGAISTYRTGAEYQ